MTRRKALLVALNENSWQITVMFIPGVRAVLYALGVTPSPLSEDVLPKFIQVAALALLGIAAGIGLIGVLLQRALTERMGLRLLWPISVIYGSVLLYSDWRRGLLWCVVYGCISIAAWRRQREITKAARITSKVLRDET